MSTTTSPPLPRVTIRFCTQCKWMLRAAYYAQELLSTFSLALGEVALQPATGGTFVVAIERQPQPQLPDVLWDRRVDGGFPETKELKRRLRDLIEPGRDLGHVDRHQRPAEPSRGAVATGTGGEEAPAPTAVPGPGAGGDGCEDCAP